LTKGNKSTQHPPRLRVTKKSESLMADQPDARELWAQDCLAKANYCEFTLGIEVDRGYREWLQKLAAEWKRAAKGRARREERADAIISANGSSTGSGPSQSSHK
jgi:hypothetical protein